MSAIIAFPDVFELGVIANIAISLPMYYPEHENHWMQRRSFDQDNHDINYEGDATTSDGTIHLTLYERDNIHKSKGPATYINGSKGRATYIKPMQLGDKTSGNLTDFSTRFSFVIHSNYSNPIGDGLAFFLAPNGSHSPPQTEGGGLGLGIVGSDQPVNLTEQYPFVAVEFDTYSNPWDPDENHVGIDINSVKSVKYVPWPASISDGIPTEVWISYNATLKNLSVSVTKFVSDKAEQATIYYKVDLRDYLPEWVTFGFSATTGSSIERHYICSWSFSSDLQVYETYETDPMAVRGGFNPSPNIPDTSRRGNKRVMAGLIIGACVVACGIGLLSLCFWRKWAKGKSINDHVFNKTMDGEFEKGMGPKRFPYKELARATKNFVEEEKLGEGGFGGVYKGFLRDLNTYVAIKRVSRASRQGVKEYVSEVNVISRLRHRNLVQLLGWCHERRELLLVYEFMPNGSLDSLLYKEKSLLPWDMRYKIAQGLASALLYLHEEWEQCVVHRDVKSSNIMLDSSFNTKLGDFGLARFVDHEKGSQTTDLAGTMGYVAPECVLTGKASRESDVYSFGIVALEITCGRKPIDPKAEESQIILVEWVWELYGMGKILEAADPKLCADFDEREMERLMIVGLWCAHPDINCRPLIRQAIHVLTFEASLPSLPAKMPVPTYLSPPVLVPSSLCSLNYSAPALGNNQIRLLNYSYNN
ncbi:hypothetical protein F0562_028830 [Nyssa sinensis]|uniref:non-specific serine/threonine protein kinase n=1 Tax=Nyssa sinensis TaxID=561372 RepID=A0A5J5B3C1_9ASTE|nr:hypothetical protein F0562_028830 [Nyssa sinensis]